MGRTDVLKKRVEKREAVQTPKSKIVNLLFLSRKEEINLALKKEKDENFIAGAQDIHTLKPSLLLGGKSADPQLICTNLILQSRFFFDSSEYFKSLACLENAIAIASKHEFYKEQLEINRLYRAGIVFYGRKNSFLNTDLDKLSSLIKLFSDAEILNEEIRCFHYDSDLNYKFKLKLWEQKNSLLSKNSLVKSSLRVQLLLTRINIQLSLIKNAECNIAKELYQIEKLQKEELFKGEKHLSSVIDCFSAFSAFANKKESASRKLFDKISTEEFSQFLFSDISLLEKCFVMSYHFEQYKKSAYIVDAVRANAMLENNLYLKFRWNYYEINFLMQRNKFSDASKLLMNTPLCNKDRTEAELYLSVLSVINHIENKRFDILDHTHLTLQKFFSRNSAKYSKSDPRLSLIFKFMKTLAGNKFNMEKTLNKEMKTLVLLKEGKGKHAWNPLSHEMMRFDEWVTSKIK